MPDPALINEADANAVPPTVAGSTVIVISSVEGAQMPLLIVHLKVFMPTDKPVTPEPGSPGVVTVPEPAITVQLPVPTPGGLPANVAVVEQTVWSDPAFAVVGASSRLIVTSSVEEAQTPLLIVHLNVFTPVDKPVTPEPGSPGVATVPDPVMTVQVPVPTARVLPASVTDVEQTV